MQSIKELAATLFQNETLIYGVLSDSRGPEGGPRKVTLRKTALKGALCYQAETHQDNRVYHRNLTPAEGAALVEELLGPVMRQGVFHTREADWQVRLSKKGKPAFLKRPPSRQDAVTAHNRTKQHLIPEGEPVPWLVALDIMLPDGTVRKSRYDKFRQINRYLEFVEDCLPALAGCSPLRIVDFGCGKSYLTFALYDHLVNRRGLSAVITGLDLKADVVAHCAGLARELGFEGLRFEVGDIGGYRNDAGADLVISLHACDRATDAALGQAVRWGARVILAVPCCQKELIRQFAVPGLEPLLAHGILRERLGAMATDTLRALALEAMGYETQIMEFIDMEHTPKNLLIRAVLTRAPEAAFVRKYCEFKKTIGVVPGLENDFGNVFKGLLKGCESQ